MSGLVGIAEIANLLGVSKQRASQIVAADGFPKPKQRLAMGPVWTAASVERWIAEHRS